MARRVEHDISGDDLERVQEDVEEAFPGCTPEPRYRLLLYREYVELFLEGEKETTVRFEEGKVDVPGRERVPLIVSFPDSDEEVPIGNLDLAGMVVKPFGDLTEVDAERDGFDSREELRKALEDIYGTIPGEHPVTIYSLEPAESMSNLRDMFEERVEG